MRWRVGPTTSSRRTFPSKRGLIRIRSWTTLLGREAIPGGAAIWGRLQRFRADLPAMCREAQITEAELTFVDRTQLISKWLLATVDQAAATAPD